MQDKIIERGKQSLSFVEQLQNQIQLCREALSDNSLPLTPKVETLEALLWAKLKDDEEFLERKQEIGKEFKQKTKGLEISDYSTKDMRKYHSFKRKKSKDLFKAIIIFIDKKGLMPIGDEDE